MRIGITGTPGTGKTTVTEKLEDLRTVQLTEFAKKNGVGHKEEREYKVDVEALRKKAKELESSEIVFEGHLAHHLDLDYCVVLRCDPEKLRKRLSNRDYDEKKIEENVESEALDLILQQALEKQKKVYEIDTTEQGISETVEKVRRGIEEEKTSFGDIDWSNKL